MSSKTGLIALCWALTLAAAYAAGRPGAPWWGGTSESVVAEGAQSELHAALRERELVARAASLARVLQNLDAASFPDASDVFEQPGLLRSLGQPVEPVPQRVFGRE